MTQANDGADWRPSASLETLRQRADWLAAARSFFHRHGYWEVDTPLLSHDTVVDRNLDPIPAELRRGRVGPGRRLYLQTSPEFAMKRLIAAGAERIYQFAHAFRNGEAGSRHNPEFTLLEWYAVGETHFDQMDFTESLVRHLFAFPASWSAPRPSLPEFPFERITYDDAFERAVGTRVLARATDELPALCRQAGVDPPASLAADDRDGWLNLLLAERVEPFLATRGAVFLYDFPASQAALARVRDEDPPVAERFELYLDGIELCNGYHELTSAAELARRTRSENEQRRADGVEPLPEQSRLHAAMNAGFPSCAGVALGFDRLLMRYLGTAAIADVLAFPIDRA